MSTNTTNDLVPRTGTFPSQGSEADSAPRKVKVNSQAVVLVIILGVSAAALASMRHIGMKSGISYTLVGDAPQAAMVQDDPEKVARYDRIMKDLRQLQQPLDIALGELAKIPALIPTDRKIDTSPGGPIIASDPVDTASRDRLAHIAKNRTDAAKLKLQSCMGGKVPLARIDGKFYRLGDLVNEKFIVRGIENRSATVEADGETYQLEMESGKPGSSPKGKR
jgi:hypothetical protein